MKAYLCACQKLKSPPSHKIQLKYIELHTKQIAYSFSSILQSCDSIQELKQLHAQILLAGFQNNNGNVSLWNAIMGEYVRQEYLYEALRLYSQMQYVGMKADSFSYPVALKACGGLTNLPEGRQIHSQILRMGYEADVFVGTGLLDMYGKCGIVEDARKVFDKMPQRDIASWNAMISGYAQSGGSLEALKLFKGMQQDDLKPNASTLVGMLALFARFGELKQGLQIHGYVVKSGCESNIFVGTSIVELYTKCGVMKDGAMMFESMPVRSVVSWNAMISGYSENGCASEALRLFDQMQLGHVKIDSLTIVSVLPACAQLRDVQKGKLIHDYAIRSGFEHDVIVGTSLVDMYSKCGAIHTARQLLDRMPEKNVVSWSAMIGGYASNGCPNEALKLYNKMQLENVQPNSVTLMSMLGACTLLGAIQQGKAIHNYIVKRGLDLDINVQNTLVDMYAKCGSIELSWLLFNKMSNKNLASWNAMIAGYRIHGLAKDAISLFGQMQLLGIRPDHITFVCVLSACSHAGLVDEGWGYFDSMIRDYCVVPQVKHYACMADLLGRSGHLDEAQSFIRNMPVEPDASVWGALLGACRIYNNIKLGEQVADHLIDLEPDDAGYYVLISNIYATAGRWDDVVKVRKIMKDKGVKKTPGCSLVEVNNRVYPFLVRDRSHPQSKKIYDTLEALAVQMKEVGYIPDTNFVLHDIEEEGKENMLCSHSEKLAIAFALLNTSPGTPIRITKNLRVCGDCHTVTKFISKIVNRKIIVRDANRFHHFNNGLCSCGDYW